MKIETNTADRTHRLTAETEAENNIIASIHDFVASCPGVPDEIANDGGYTRRGQNYCTVPFRAPSMRSMNEMVSACR